MQIYNDGPMMEKDVKQIQRSLENCDKAIAYLRERLDKLYEIITPVLSPPRVGNISEDEAKPQSKAPLSEMIDKQVSMIEGTTRKVETIIQRVEL